MTFSPGPGFAPGPPPQPGYPVAGGAPRLGGDGRGRDPDFVRNAIIATMAGALLFVVIGMIAFFRPFGRDIAATPSTTATSSATGNSQPSSDPTVTVTVTMPPETGTTGPSATGTTPKPTTATPSTTGAIPWPPDSMSLCNDQTAVNQVTSCGFAEVMSNVWSTFGPGTYLVDSPTTGQTYSMTCQLAGPDLGYCFGGNNAQVYLRSAPGHG